MSRVGGDGRLPRGGKEKVFAGKKKKSHNAKPNKTARRKKGEPFLRAKPTQSNTSIVSLPV